MDPITIALLFGSSALGGIGGISENVAKNKFAAQNTAADIQQLMQDRQAAALRNQELAKYTAAAQQFGAENRGNLQQGVTAFNPGADSATRQLVGLRLPKRSAPDPTPMCRFVPALPRRSAPNSPSSLVTRLHEHPGKAGDWRLLAAMAI